MVSTALAGVGLTTGQLHSSRQAFSSGRQLASRSIVANTRRTCTFQPVHAATRKSRSQPQDEAEDDAPAGPAFNLRSLFGGGGRQTEAEAPAQLAAPGRGGASVRNAQQGTARIKGGAKQRGGTTKVGVRKERLGTQRVGGKRQGRIGGGTTVIGGGRRKDAGPRGLFGGRSGRRDTQLVFVAGGTGRLGARVVRQLLLQGLKVRVGVRSTDKAQAYLDTAMAYGLLPKGTERRVQIVEYDVTQPDTIAAAIGSASKVVSAIGAAEALNFSAPKQIDGEGGINLVNAAKAAGVEHFIMVTSLGTGKFGWPAGILNLFGGVLIQKKRAEQALEASGMCYTIVRPGGMERPGDDFKATHNITIAERDTTFGGQISRLQVAEIIGTAIARTELAENKVLEVWAETSAPRREIELLLADAPQEAPQAARAATAQAIDDAEELLAYAQEEQAFLRDEYADTQDRLAELAQEEQDAPNARAMQRVTRSIQDAERQLGMLQEGAEQAQRQEAAAKAVLKAAQDARKQREALTAEQVSRIQNDILFPPTAEEIEERRQAEQQAKEEAAASERAERERVAEEARQEREAAAAKQKQEQEERAAKARAEADAKRKAEEERRATEAKARQDAQDAARAEQKKKEDDARQKREAAAAQQKKEQEERAAQKKKEQEEREAARAKADAEAKAAREQEQKEKEAARAKAESEAKAKKEQEEKQQEEARAKAAAEAKAREEQQEKDREAAQSKVAADAKAQAEQEEKEQREREKRRAGADAEAKAQKEQDAKAQQEQQRKDAEAQAKQAADAVKQTAQKAGDGVAAAAELAKSNASEARAWIQNWRDNGTSWAEEAAEEAAEQTGGLFGGFRWPWQQEQEQQQRQQQQQQQQQQQRQMSDSADSDTAAEQRQSQAASPTGNGDAGMEGNAESAREWINKWRSSPSSNGDAGMEGSAESAREWINKWRAKNQ